MAPQIGTKKAWEKALDVALIVASHLKWSGKAGQIERPWDEGLLTALISL
jgi:hypothetical protein